MIDHGSSQLARRHASASSRRSPAASASLQLGSIRRKIGKWKQTRRRLRQDSIEVSISQLDLRVFHAVLKNRSANQLSRICCTDMGGSGFLWIWRFIMLIQFTSGVLGWGKEGHYATCKIAEAYLTEDAKAAINRLLPDYAKGDLASLCSWADEMRFHMHWSSVLHYVDTPDFKCNYEYCRDCHDLYTHKDRCVTGAIYNYTKQLEPANDSYMIANYNLTEALLFLSHFVGDVHQPLHAGFTGDLGGNTIIVRWYRRKTNLHHVWDDMIIDSALKVFYQSDLSMMIQAIQRNITEGWSNSMQLWEDCASDQTACANPYASESIKLACKYAYRHATPGSTLTDDYFLSRLPIVEKRLAQGGVRLAAILNRVFASGKRIAR